jgi:hypothetical protein
MIVYFNFDTDLATKVAAATQAEAFRALPVRHQVDLLKPYLDAQKKRDAKRLGAYERVRAAR